MWLSDYNLLVLHKGICYTPRFSPANGLTQLSKAPPPPDELSVCLFCHPAAGKQPTGSTEISKLLIYY